MGSGEGVGTWEVLGGEGGGLKVTGLGSALSGRSSLLLPSAFALRRCVGHCGAGKALRGANTNQWGGRNPLCGNGGGRRNDFREIK